MRKLLNYFLINASHFPEEVVIIPNNTVLQTAFLRLWTVSCLTGRCWVPSHSFDRAPGWTLGISLAVLEESTSYPCDVLVGFCCRAAGPVWFWTGDSHGVTGPTTVICVSDCLLFTKCPLLCTAPNLLLVHQLTRSFCNPTVGPTETSGCCRC